MQLTQQIAEVAGRAVYACPHCKLKQFLLPIQKCRRCKKTMLVASPEQAVQLLPVMPPPPPVQSKGDRLYAVLSARLVILRMAKGWSQHDLSEHIARGSENGSSHSWISRVETGAARPSVGMAERFATTLGVPFCELTREFTDNWLHDEVHELLPLVPKQLLPALRKFLYCLVSDKEVALDFAHKMGIPVRGKRK